MNIIFNLKFISFLYPPSEMEPELIIKKPKIDDRIYKFITLNNELKVLLVSDKEADMSAACLDVNVGQLWDPITR